MKSSAYFIVVLLCIFLISCQKETGQSIPMPIESPKIILPKQLISVDNSYTPASTLVASIKFDTANQRIDFYSDDTTNSNPYDELIGTYKYNAGGYLISHEIFEHGNVIEKSTINRDANNKITWIAHEQKAFDKKDTSFFTYQTSSRATKITTVVHTYYPALPVFVDTYLYTYDTNNKLMHVLDNSGTVTYEYNVNNSLRRIFSEFGDFKNEINFFYASGLTDDKEDGVLKTFLGKDFWVQNIKDLYFLSSLQQDRHYTVSATDPYHPTRIQDVQDNKGVVTTEERTTHYELNDRKLLHKITGSLDGQHETTLIFKY